MNGTSINIIIGNVAFWTIQVILICAKIFGAIDWSWWLVLLPLLISTASALLLVVALVIVQLTRKSESKPNPRTKK